MKYYDLDEEEKQLLADYEAGLFGPVKNSKDLKVKFQLAARNTLAKTRNMNLRVSEKVYIKLKAKAAEFGIPYQTMASSVLHRFALS